MSKTVLILSILIIMFSGCESADSSLCGELPPQYKKNMELCEKYFAKYYTVEPVPCELSYVNVFLKTTSLDTIKLDSFQSVLCQSGRKQVWSSIDLYDLKGKYLFTRHKNGVRSKVGNR